MGPITLANCRRVVFGIAIGVVVGSFSVMSQGLVVGPRRRVARDRSPRDELGIIAYNPLLSVMSW
jgi:hypothetical protein